LNESWAQSIKKLAIILESDDELAMAFLVLLILVFHSSTLAWQGGNVSRLELHKKIYKHLVDLDYSSEQWEGRFTSRMMFSLQSFYQFRPHWKDHFNNSTSDQVLQDLRKVLIDRFKDELPVNQSCLNRLFRPHFSKRSEFFGFEPMLRLRSIENSSSNPINYLLYKKNFIRFMAFKMGVKKPNLPAFTKALDAHFAVHGNELYPFDGKEYVGVLRKLGHLQSDPELYLEVIAYEDPISLRYLDFRTHQSFFDNMIQYRQDKHPKFIYFPQAIHLALHLGQVYGEYPGQKPQFLVCE